MLIHEKIMNNSLNTTDDFASLAQMKQKTKQPTLQTDTSLLSSSLSPTPNQTFLTKVDFSSISKQFYLPQFAFHFVPWTSSTIIHNLIIYCLYNKDSANKLYMILYDLKGALFCIRLDL